jgi:hypothetical protein
MKDLQVNEYKKDPLIEPVLAAGPKFEATPEPWYVKFPRPVLTLDLWTEGLKARA